MKGIEHVSSKLFSVERMWSDEKLARNSQTEEAVMLCRQIYGLGNPNPSTRDLKGA